MKYHIGYYGGAAGDFLRGLMVSGLKDIKSKFEDNKLLVKYPHEWKPVITIMPSGKVEVTGPIEIDDDRYRGIKLGHSIGKPINQVKEYWLKCQKEGLDFQTYLIDKARIEHGGNNGWYSETSISVGHEHINFIDTFNNLNEWHQHIRNRRKVDKIIYITINTMLEANQRWINNSQKNKPGEDRLPEEDRQLIHLKEHQEIHNTLVKEKHENDIIFPFKYIYKKEYLREWLRTEFDWNDRCYDALYDAWYNKQDVII